MRDLDRQWWLCMGVIMAPLVALSVSATGWSKTATALVSVILFALWCRLVAWLVFR